MPHLRGNEPSIGLVLAIVQAPSWWLPGRVAVHEEVPAKTHSRPDVAVGRACVMRHRCSATCSSSARAAMPQWPSSDSMVISRCRTVLTGMSSYCPVVLAFRLWSK